MGTLVVHLSVLVSILSPECVRNKFEMRATFFVLCAIMAVAMSLPTDSKPAIKPAADLAPNMEAVKAEDKIIEDLVEEEDEDEDDEAVEDEEDEDEDDDEEDEDDDDEEDEEETPAEELPVMTL